jgi:hypothetical protein
MARKLKTYQTSLGFFDQAIAAPSMEAALEAWGADSNLFHQGAAKKSDDPDVIAATMARPGVVLRRPVGSNGSFREQAELPTDLGDSGGRPAKAARKSKAPKPKRTSSRPADKAAEQKAALAYERERKRRDREREKEKAARQKERANAGSKPSTRCNRRWTRLNGSMRREPEPSRPRRTLSRRERKPKMPAGKRRRSGWMRRCTALGARVPSTTLADLFTPLLFADLSSAVWASLRFASKIRSRMSWTSAASSGAAAGGVDLGADGSWVIRTR